MFYPEPIAIQSEEQELFPDVFSVASGVWRVRDVFVNIYVVCTDTGWVLIDTGLRTSYAKIKKLVKTLFGTDSRPDAIVLTHAHFDHVGTVKRLVQEWDVFILAHPLEIPYLTALSKYPPADPTVGGGTIVYLSWLYPRDPINISGSVIPLAGDGSISSMPGWRWIHTPGHSPGHISLYREEDGCLIAGDAFVSTDQRKISAVTSQKKEIHGPPPYFTPDWHSSAASVRTLAALKPNILATGHGRPFYGTLGQQALDRLARQFHALAVPTHGRYVPEPALADEEGVYYVPPIGPHQRKIYALMGLAILGLLSITLGGVLFTRRRLVS